MAAGATPLDGVEGCGTRSVHAPRTASFAASAKNATNAGPRRAGQILVADAGEARDDRLERRAGIDERREALANAHRAFAVERHARGSDLDDAICRRVEPRRFEV